MAHLDFEMRARIAEAAAPPPPADVQEKANVLYKMMSEEKSFAEFMQQISAEHPETEKKVRTLCVVIAQKGPFSVTRIGADSTIVAFWKSFDTLVFPDGFWNEEPEELEHEEPEEVEPQALEEEIRRRRPI